MPELKLMKRVWSSKKQARRSVEFKCCTRLSFVDQGQVKTPTREDSLALWKVLVREFQEYGGECRGSGSSLLIFIELALSTNDKL